MRKTTRPKPLEAYVFFDPECRRCKRIHKVVRKAQKELNENYRKGEIGVPVKFINMNLSKHHVSNRIAPKYKVARIPTIVPLTGEKPRGCGSLYWVGIPDHDDLCGVMRYLAIERAMEDG